MPDERSPATAGAAAEFTEYLELLVMLTEEFGHTLDVEQTIRRGLERITEILSAEASSLFMLEETPDGGQDVVCTVCIGPVDISGLRLPIDQGIVGRSIRDNSCEIVRDVREDPAFGAQVDEKTGFTTRSILCAPLSIKDRCIGAIELINKVGGEGLFDSRDQSVLRVLASTAAMAFINAQQARALVDQERLQRELELAAEIQRALLPKSDRDGLPIFGVNLPARRVSGDFFDYMTLPDGRVLFALGDVSGKGMDAALLMAKTASVFRALGKREPDPGALLAHVNEEVCETATRGKFVTMAVGLMDLAEGRVTLANAGHEPPLLHLPDGTFLEFEAEQPPLGIVPGLEFPDREIALRGGTLYVFTDGVTEASEHEQMLGQEGFKTLVRSYRYLPLPERVRSITARIRAFNEELHDDVTLLAIGT
ncbi:MAG: GAF domain-containing SpoIIE family protein phosphatase [Acetobacterales bacterium]